FVSKGDRICLVGRNGSGKSTLLKIAAGLIEADTGEIFVQPGTSIRYLAQEPDFSNFKTVLEYAHVGIESGDYLHQTLYFLEQLGLNGDEKLANLSGGERRRVALAQVLAAKPEILLLDEPTNHLDIEAIEWLEAYLKTSSSALVLISHDRRFLQHLSNATVWLSLGKTRRLDKNFDKFEVWRDTILQREEVDAHKHDRKILSEENWLRYGVTARRKRNVRRLRELGELRQQRRERRIDNKVIKLEVIEANRTGKLVFEEKNISKRYADRNIVKDFSIRILRGDRVGFVGRNGAGKTTLVKMLIGTLKPDEGSVRHGSSSHLVTLDQGREELDLNESLSDALTGGKSDMVFVGDQQRHVVSYMKDFLFQPEQAKTPVGALSGGEKGRLMLARAFAKPSNIIILDEPTNDLDLETLDLLQEMISEYKGTVLLVSHDRDFIDRIVTSTLTPDIITSGIWTEYAGGYSDMLIQRGEASPKIPIEKKKQPVKQNSMKKKTQRMTYKDKHTLTILPQKIEDLRSRIETIQNEISDPGLYNKNKIRFEDLTRELATMQIELTQSEELWLTLELKRDEIENN
ncbi:MAG: ATP-binding cassette domain-containing protein, partial [Pseudomonadota bacterium]|nr:ATP-binding cassette domain-containing protein [Pseudomonadota bacterium]